MSLILHIDTATETAGIYLALEGVMIAASVNQQQQDHAKWIHPAIEQLMKESGFGLPVLKAIAITNGPGSYTGLRVGMATAKGLCYALSIPLITESTLKVMAAAVIRQNSISPKTPSTLYCPIIDARRMEVFAAVYDEKLEERLTPRALILSENSFKQELDSSVILFFGSGAGKWQSICHHLNASFGEVVSVGPAFAALSYSRYEKNLFTPLAYAEPVYLKEFYTHPK